MQTRIIPNPSERNEILDVLRIVGIVTYEDKDRVVLCFNDSVSLKELAKKYPHFGTLIGEPSEE